MTGDGDAADIDEAAIEEAHSAPAAAAIEDPPGHGYGVSLMDLRLRHCRCVTGHDGRLALFCGETTVSETSSWCAAHKAEFTRTSPRDWERAAVRVRKQEG